MSVASFYQWWEELPSLMQYMLKDNKMDLLIQEAIRSGEVQMEVGPIEFVPFVNQEGQSFVKGRLIGKMKFKIIQE